MGNNKQESKQSTLLLQWIGDTPHGNNKNVQQSLAGGSLGHDVEEGSPNLLCTVDPGIPVQ
jgi:hypothetical protein